MNWLDDKPEEDGTYMVRGFDLSNPHRIAVVMVDWHNDNLVTNLHDSSSATVEEFSYLVSDLGDHIEWLELIPDGFDAWILEECDRYAN